MIDYIFLIPLFPLIGVLINGIFGKKYLNEKIIGFIACTTIFFSFIFSISIFCTLIGELPEMRHHQIKVYDWIISDQFKFEIKFLADPLSAVMMLVVAGVGFLIHIYSLGYMHNDPGYFRFFAYLNLFAFSMLILVSAGNFLMMFVGWEGVGLCSYLLIGFWYEKKSASDAGKKAFVVNRVGDFGFILAMLLILTTFDTLDFAEVFAQAPERLSYGGILATAICLLLFIGATGKSAQIPLYVWLPDAMEGPTPVSALIHAATMVTAGVYMVARCNILYTLSPVALTVVAVIGVATAIYSASIGLVQNDIKRVLAYSTISQLGYMFLACGVSAFSAGIFHLTTHAFFKALLFLGSGSVIHALSGEQDMRRMGGLKDHLPITYPTFLIATLAIAGFPPLSGFFSKDEILFKAFESSFYLWLVGAIAAFMTAFYMFRLVYLTFFGKPRMDDHIRHHIHESPSSMTIPLTVLAIFSIIAGFIGIPDFIGEAFGIHHINLFEKFLHPVFEQAHLIKQAHHHHLRHFSGSFELGMMMVSVLIALAGFLTARKFYLLNPELPGKIVAKAKWVYQLVLNKYYVDEIYDLFIVEPTKSFGNFLWDFDALVIDGIVNGASWFTRKIGDLSRVFDLNFIDGAVNLIADICRNFGDRIRRIQTGMLQNYALIMAIGVFILISIYLLF